MHVVENFVNRVSGRFRVWMIVQSKAGASYMDKAAFVVFLVGGRWF